MFFVIITMPVWMFASFVLTVDGALSYPENWVDIGLGLGIGILGVILVSIWSNKMSKGEK